jgi:hypothetical protein
VLIPIIKFGAPHISASELDIAGTLPASLSKLQKLQLACLNDNSFEGAHIITLLARSAVKRRPVATMYIYENLHVCNAIICDPGQ